MHAGLLLTIVCALDFDPEALEEENWAGEVSDESEDSGDEEGHDGREHYVAVGYADPYRFHCFCFAR